MNPQVPNELVSAYFDGEASPEERAAVENLLDASTETRRELDEISQLSALLHSFPRESAPVELIANVQRATDQKPLAVKPIVSASAAPRSLRREWTAAALASVLTAAALMLMVNVTDRSGPRNWALSERNEVAMTAANRSSGEERLAMKAARLGDVAENLHQSTLEQDKSAKHERLLSEKESLAEISIPHEPAAGGVLSPTAASKSVRKLNPANTLDDAKSDNRGTQSTLEAQQFRNGFGANGLMTENSVILNNGDFLNGLKVGQVYTFVPQVADPESNVAVIDLEVIDIERGVDEVQILLARHSIKPRLAADAQASEEKRNLNRQKKMQNEVSKNGGSNELVAVYSCGPGEKLAKTLEDISQHPDLFLSWSSQPPVQLPVGEVLTDELADGTTVANKNKPSDRASFDKQTLAAAKDSPTDDDMDGEAELALNALLVRNNYSNTAVNFDSPTNNLFKEQSGVAKLDDSRGATATTPRSQPTPAKPDATRDRKTDPVAKKSLEQRSAYQTTLRVTNDAPVVNEQPLLLARSQGQNSGGLNTNRRFIAGHGLPQAAMNTNNPADANQAVKVLFVLHAAQTPAPAEKPNR